MSQLVVRVEVEWIPHTTPQPTTPHTPTTAPPSLHTAPQSEHLTGHLRDTVEQPPTQSGDVETPPLPG